jgi:transketolase C-terminal domain/subunit
MHTVKSLDAKAVQVAAKETRLIVTVEDVAIRVRRLPIG